MCNEEVRELAQQGVGCDAREPVRPATLEAHAQLRERYVGAHILAGQLVYLAQQAHALGYLVVALLCHHEFDAALVVLSHKLAEHVGLVVLASQSHYQHAASVGVQHHVAQYLLRVLVVIAQLRAAVVVGEGHDGVHALSARLLLQQRGQLIGYAVHAAYGGDYPYLVAYAHLAIGAAVTLEGQLPLGNVECYGVWLVGVVEQSREVGAHMVLVYPVALLHSLDGMSYGVAILDDVLTLGKVLQRHLMSCWDILVYVDGDAIYSDLLACLERFYGHGHIVGRIDLEIRGFHCCILSDVVFCKIDYEYTQSYA